MNMINQKIGEIHSHSPKDFVRFCVIVKPLGGAQVKSTKDKVEGTTQEDHPECYKILHEHPVGFFYFKCCCLDY